MWHSYAVLAYPDGVVQVNVPKVMIIVTVMHKHCNLIEANKS